MLENDVKSMARLLCKAVATPVARAVWHAVDTNDLAGIGSIAVNPGDYADSETYFRDACCVALLKKFNDESDKTLQEELKKKASQTFTECETQCAYSNRRLSDFIYNTVFHDGKDERYWRFLQVAKRLIKSWLGPLPTELNMKFGKGATRSDKGRLTTIMDKMSSRPTMTRDADLAIPFWTRTSWFRALASEYPHKSEPLVIDGNRFDTVPKDCRKRRCIAIEPSLNIAYQLAVGKVIRSRLKFLGIDLDQNQGLHRALARWASVSGFYSTLDLSNASDTICRNLVRILLPLSWFEVLDGLRSPKTEVNGRWYVLEKFSSMGNGFTFELETLLFLALICAIDESGLRPGQNVFVYGDDIIIPTRYTKAATGVLTWAGFSLNKEKSFSSGSFRESCGGDYFCGRAVRPFHLEEAPSKPTDWMAMANKIYCTAVDSYLDGDYELAQSMRTSAFLGWLQPVWSHCISQVPNKIRKLRGPSGRQSTRGWLYAGDGWFYDSREKWNYRVRNGIRYIRGLRVATRSKSLELYPGSVALASLVYGVPSAGVAPRNARERVIHTVVPFS